MTYTKSLDAGHVEEAQAAQSRTSGRLARRAWTTVLALCLSLGFSFVNAGSASALNEGDVISTNFLRNWETGRCLGLSETGEVITSQCINGWGLQQWDIVYRLTGGVDYVWIRLHGTNLCLSYENDVSVRECNIWTDFTWAGFGAGWDKVQLMNSETGTYLDSNYAGNVYLHDYNGGGYQTWKSGY
ncbi:RICIN domain-containing protein [Streptomyces sp. NBC_00075]|uniref:RICIN domain-containing protein n=1 Tax=Streptomyces sp. NBC_00075 TaxID=2975641 RepID=UPI003253105E